MPLMPLRNHRLSWEERKTLRDRLVRRASVLQAEVGQALHQRDDATRGLVDPRDATDDEPVAGLQAAIDLAALRRDAAELDEIDSALQRLESDAFGRCVGCGAPIAWDRLLARPEVQRCTRCQAAAERAAPPPPSL